jgi:hypothetical protein
MELDPLPSPQLSLLLDLLLMLALLMRLFAKEMKLLVSMFVLDLVQVGKLGKLLKPLMVSVLVDKLG